MPAEATQSWGGVAWLTCSNAISGLKAYAASIIAYADPITAYAALIIAVIALIVSIVGLGYSYRWWRRQQQQSNTLEQNLAEAAAWITVGSACVVMIIFIGSSFVANKLSKPITPPAEKIYYAYEPYPILPFVTCPERRSACHPPVLFLRMKWDTTIRSMEDKSYFWDAKVYEQPEWADVADDLKVAEQYNHKVLKQLGLASTAVEERDTTVTYHMYQAQTDLERLDWSRLVGSDVASKHTTPNKTSSRILCDFLSDTGNIQEHFLAHTTMTEVERSIYQQQKWTLQTVDRIRITSALPNPWFRSSGSAMRSLTIKLEGIFFQRIEQGSSHAKDFQEYKAVEQDALKQIRERQSVFCERADREDAGEKEEMSIVKIGLQVMDISDMTWIIGAMVRKGASHVSADATPYDPNDLY
ncbi:hypothetical protein HBH69_219770 [Parastagonospora nodorum]|nr:hypothetical protein HBH69_219770 [Parastagonospora nodorum]